jgi:hypothetical protein
MGCDWGLEYPTSDMGAYGGNNGDIQTGVVYDDITLLPESIFNLHNYPNPFNAVTTISFTLPYGSHANLTIYDLLGRRVETIIDQILPDGYHSIGWDASGKVSGTYFYVIKAGDRVDSGKMILLK